MPPRKTRDVLRVLVQKGFRVREGDHKYIYFYHNNKKTQVRTKVSQGSREIDAGLLSAMSRQVRLSRSQFEDLLDCPLSEEAFAGILKGKQLIDE